MLNSSHSLPARNRGLRALLMACAIGLLAGGSALAQVSDFPAVEQRLRAAVKAGELTAKEADALTHTMKNSPLADEPQIEERLRQAIAAGEMTVKQATSMMDTLNDLRGRKRLQFEIIDGSKRRTQAGSMGQGWGRGIGSAKGKGSAPVEDTYDQAEARVRRAEAKGAITPKQAEKRIEAISDARRKSGRTTSDQMDAIDAARARLSLRVASGKLSPQQAQDQLSDVEEYLRRTQKSHTNEQEALEAAEKRIKDAVRSGKLTDQEGSDRINALRETQRKNAGASASQQETFEKNIGIAVQDGDLSAVEGARRVAQYRQAKEAYQSVKNHLLAEVKAGKLNQDQATDMLNRLRENLARSTRPAAAKATSDSYEEAVARIREAIRDGRITEDEGRRRLALLRERVSAENGGETAVVAVEDQEELTLARYEALEASIRQQVADGKISADEAEQRIKNLLERMNRSARPDEDPNRFNDPNIVVENKDETPQGVTQRLHDEEDKIRSDVRSGKKSTRQGRSDIAALWAKAANKTPAAIEDSISREETRLRAAIKEGRLTKEAAKKELKEFKSGLVDQSDSTDSGKK